MDDLERYTEFVYGNQSGYVYAPLKVSDEDWQTKFYQWPEQKQELHDWVRTNGDDPKVQAVYISPVLYKEKRAQKGSVKSSQVVWVEFDGQEKIDFSKLGVKPDMIIQTSGSTHLHCYWKVEGQKPEILEDISHRLTYLLEADFGGWDMTQLLRPPNSWNRKKEYPQPYEVKLAHYDPTGKHETKVFDKAPVVESKTPTIPIDELLSYKQVLREVNLPIPLLRRVMSETVKGPENGKEGSRSSFLTKIAYELVEERLTHLQVVSLLAHVDERIKKFVGRSDRMLRLTQLADQAFHKVAADNEILLYTIDDVLTQTEELEWILPGWLHTSGFMIITSAPGVGKTQLCMQLGTQLISQKPFIGKSAYSKRKEKILFLSLEMDIRSLRYIISHQKPEWPEGFEANRFVIMDEGDTPLTALEGLIEQVEPTVIILDSLSEIMGDSADQNTEAKAALRWIRKIRRRYGIAFVAIHHNRKANENNKKPNKLSDLYGSFLFAKDTDTVVNLWDLSDSIEVSGLKVRFGEKGAYGEIKRNEHLWFELQTKEKKDARNESRSDTGIKGFNFNFGQGSD